MRSSTESRPLGIRAELSLSPEQLEMMHKLEVFDLWFVEERLARKGILAPERLAPAVLEFKRYFALVGLGYRNLGMLSPEADEVWHAFILFTREYAEFCQDAFGMFIHHVPRTSRSPLRNLSSAAFLEAYAEVFGEAARASYAVAIGSHASNDEPSGCGTEDCSSN
jgi:hypothetical protein